MYKIAAAVALCTKDDFGWFWMSSRTAEVADSDPLPRKLACRAHSVSNALWSHPLLDDENPVVFPKRPEGQRKGAPL